MKEMISTNVFLIVFAFLLAVLIYLMLAFDIDFENGGGLCFSLFHLNTL